MSNKIQTARCRLFVLSLAKHAKRRVVLRCIIAMSPCCLAYKSILRFKQSDNVTSRQHAARQPAVWRTLLATGRQDDSPTMRRLALCPVVASANTHKSVPNQPPYNGLDIFYSKCKYSQRRSTASILYIWEE
jgi:hypothetical protein